MIFSHPAASVTTQAIAALAARGAPLVICGPDFRPVGYLLPVDGHHAQGDRIEAQAGGAFAPAQAPLGGAGARENPGAGGGPGSRRRRRRGAMRGHRRARAVGRPRQQGGAGGAALFSRPCSGPDFAATARPAGANAFLNYGYTVLRAATARAIVGAGLHPSFSLHHRSKGDALRSGRRPDGAVPPDRRSRARRRWSRRRRASAGHRRKTAARARAACRLRHR